MTSDQSRGADSMVRNSDLERSELLAELQRLADWACTTTGGKERGHNIGRARAAISRATQPTKGVE